MRKQMIHNLLMAFNEGYQRRNPETLENFMDNLFSESASTQILGTSDQEIFYGHDSAKDLFLSDWKYWGFFQLDLEDYVVKDFGSNVLVHLNATVDQTFEDKDETYDRFVSIVSSIISGTDSETMALGQHEVAWLLNHLLHPRNQGKRVNRWPVTVDMVLSEQDSKIIIRQILFNIPLKGLFPDERIHLATPYQSQLNQDLSKISKINASKKSIVVLPDIESIKRSESFTLRNIRGELAAGSSAGELFDEALKSYAEFDFKWKNALIQSEGNTAWFIGIGMVEKILSEQEVRKNLNREIHTIIEGTMPSKDKLFKIRRVIGECNKEIALGERYKWPIRGGGTLIYLENEWLLDSFQLSYPTDVILEDKML